MAATVPKDVSHAGLADVSVLAWTEMVRALAEPAALVDATGHVIAPGKWINHGVGDPLVTMGQTSHAVVDLSLIHI